MAEITFNTGLTTKLKGIVLTTLFLILSFNSWKGEAQCTPEDFSTIFNTGNVPGPDPNWTAEWVAGPTSDYAPPIGGVQTPGSVSGIPGWATAPAGSNWISIDFGSGLTINHNNADGDGVAGEQTATNGPTGDAVAIRLTNTFTLPALADPNDFTLAFDVAADNCVSEIRVNGIPQIGAVAACNNLSTGFNPLVNVTLSNDWQSGVNTVEIETISSPSRYGFLIANSTICYDPCNAVISTDTDGDGVADFCDEDDDNDGILDSVECPEELDILIATTLEPSRFTYVNNLINEFQNYTVNGVVANTTVVQNLADPAPAGQYDGYDLVVFCSVLVSIDASHWTAIETAITTNASEAFAMFVDFCVPGCPSDNKTNAVNTLNSILSETYTLGTEDTSGDVLLNLNPSASYASNFNLLDPFEGHVYTGISGVAEADALYYSLADPTDAYALMKQIPGSQDCRNYLFFCTDLTPFAPSLYPANEGKVAPSFQDASAFCFDAPVPFADCDTDSDGTPDIYDLDSDNDGCFDVLESGGADANNDGVLGDVIPVTVDANGRVTTGSGDITGGYDGANGNETVATEIIVNTQPTDQNVTDGGVAVFTATVTATSTTDFNAGTPDYSGGSATDVSSTVTYQWYLGDPASGGTPLTNDATYSGVTSNALSIIADGSLDGNQYCVIISHPDNACFTQTDCANLAVQIQDNDNDNIPDHVDLDDDNDGILDTEEYLSCTEAQVVYLEDFGTGLDRADDPNVQNHTYDATGNLISDGSYAVVNSSSPGLAFYSRTNTNPIPDSDADGNTDGRYLMINIQNHTGDLLFYNRNLSVITGLDYRFRVDMAGLCNFCPVVPILTLNIRDGNGVILASANSTTLGVQNDDRWRRVTLNFVATTPNVTMELLSSQNSAIGGNDVGIDNIGLFALNCDTDGDGIQNHLDLDSDNDGCFDVVESGGTDANNDGVLGDIVPETVDANGQVITGSGDITGGYNGAHGNETVATEIVVNTQPTDQIVNEGNVAMFTVGATATSTTDFNAGTPDYTGGSATDVSAVMVYQWYLGDPASGGTPLTNDARYNGTTTSALSIVTDSELDGNQYCVVITHPDNACYIQTDCANLTVQVQDADNDNVPDHVDLDDDNDGILDSVECPTTTQAFQYTGADQTFTVPEGVTSIDIKIWGAGGGADCSSSGGSADGGPGGYTSGTMAVTPGEVYTVVVGEAGVLSNTGYGFGALDNGSPGNDQSGGGLSGIFTGATPVLATDAGRAILIAGGGSAGVGANGTGFIVGFPGNGPNSGGQPDFLGADTGSGVPPDDYGGGGGYNGGAFFVVDADTEGAYGGSGFIAPSVINGQILFSTTLVPPNTTDPDYIAGIGNARDLRNTPGGCVEDQAPGSGLVIISYTANIDTDGDGLADCMDLDSDNDGCFDAVESGGTDANNDGILGDIVPETVDVNGLVTTGSGDITGGYNGASGDETVATEIVVNTQPADQTVNEGNVAMFTVGATATSTTDFNAGTPDYTGGSAIDVSAAITYQWYLGDPASGGTPLTDDATYSGTTTSTLSVNTNLTLNGNQYCVVITHPDNICFTQTDCAILTALCEIPALTIGTIACDGNSGTYSISYISNGATITASSGIVGTNEITGIPLGTDVTITSSNDTSCETSITVTGPTSCPTDCNQPDLSLGQAVCDGVGSGTYTVSYTENTGATLAVIGGTDNGDGTISGTVGTDITVTASNGNCIISLDVTSPTDCDDPCEQPVISIGGTSCATDGSATYTVQYVLSPGATVVADAGVVGTGEVTNIPSGTDVTLTISYPGCEDEVLVIPSTDCPLCDLPVLTVGTIDCDGNSGTYSISYISNGTTITASSGTIGANEITGIPLGTDVTITSSNDTSCETSITVTGPTSCPTDCNQPDLSLGQAVCDGVGSGTYTVSYTENTGATLAVIGGADNGDGTISGTVGTDITVTASNGNCIISLDVTSPTDCDDPCEQPVISIGGTSCATDGSATYTVQYVLSPGATVVADAGVVGTGEVTNIPSGTDVTLTISFPGCEDEIIFVPVTQDVTPPFIETEANDLTVECGSNNDVQLNDWLANQAGAVAFDGCPGVTWTNDFTVLSDDCGNTGSATVVFTATDIFGNSSTTTAVFTIIDTTAPVFEGNLPNDLTIECDVDLPEVPVVTATDNCGDPIVAFEETIIEGDCANNYEVLRTWTATDGCGAETTHVQTITVQDTTAPVFVGTLPTDGFADCKNIPDPETLTATDNCGDVTIVFDEIEQEGDCSNRYSLIRTWTAIDVCGNEVSHTQTLSLACEIEVYNLVTPNDDGINDVFMLNGIDCYPNNTVRIYNRWGVKVFETRGYDNAGNAFRGYSDGRATVSRDEGLPTGTYFYILEYEYTGAFNPRHIKQSGHLYINN